MTVEVRANTTTTGNQSVPSVARNASGDFVIVWADADRSGIYGQRYSAAGAVQGSEFKVDTSGIDSWRVFPAVAMAPDGSFVAAWAGNDSDDSGVFARRFDAAGVAQGNDFQVNTATADRQARPSVAMDSDGDFVIAYTSEASGSYQVMAQRYNASGVAQGGEFQVNSSAGAHGDPDVAMDDTGNFTIAWQGDGTDYDIYAQRYNAAGVTQGSEFRVNTHTADAQRRAAIAMDSDGDFVVTWQSASQDGSDSGIYAQRYNAAGVAQGGEFQVNTTTSRDQLVPAIALDADGDFVITWTSFAQEAFNYGVYGQRYTAAGVARGSEFHVNTYTDDDQTDSAVAMDADGNLVAVWSSNGQDGSATGIYFNRLAASPTVSAPDLTAGTDTGESSTDNITDAATVTFTGTSDPNATIAILRDGVSQGTVTADSSGAWTYSASWPAGTYSVTATATDGGLTTSASAALSLKLFAAPAAVPDVATTVTVTGGTTLVQRVDNTTDPPSVTLELAPPPVNSTVPLSIALAPASAVTTLAAAVPGGVAVTARGAEHALSGSAAVTALQSAVGMQPGDAAATLASFTAGLTAPVLLRTVTLSASAGAGLPVTLSGGTTPAAAEAVVIDALRLPSSVPLVLDNIDFAAIRGSVTVRGGDGAGVLIGDGGYQDVQLGGGADRANGGDGADTLNGNRGNDTVDGGDGNDIVHGGQEEDLVLGGAGFDVLYGDQGNDTVAGGDNHDTLFGGAGLDSLAGGHGNDDIAGNEGADTASGGIGDDVIRGGQGGDQLQGDAGADSLHGDLGGDTLAGGEEADTLDGGAGEDRLWGGRGADLLAGGEGADTLSGDLGADTLSGGGGADRFLLAAGGGQDRITDFSFGDGDRILLAAGTLFTFVAASGSAALELTDGSRLVLEGIAAGAAFTDWVVFQD